jgi:hypothetical protein
VGAQRAGGGGGGCQLAMVNKSSSTAKPKRKARFRDQVRNQGLAGCPGAVRVHAGVVGGCRRLSVAAGAAAVDPSERCHSSFLWLEMFTVQLG